VKDTEQWKTTSCLGNKTNISVSAFTWDVTQNEKVYITLGCESPMDIEDCAFRENDKSGWCIHHKYQGKFRRCMNFTIEEAMRDEYWALRKIEEL